MSWTSHYISILFDFMIAHAACMIVHAESVRFNAQILLMTNEEETHRFNVNAIVVFVAVVIVVLVPSLSFRLPFFNVPWMCSVFNLVSFFSFVSLQESIK